MDEQFNFVEKLPEKIKKTLIDYTSGVEFSKLIDKDKEALENFKYAFRNVPPLQNPIVVYRGQINDYINDIVCVISTSTSRIVAEDFSSSISGCCIFKITIPAGVKVLPLEKISNFPSEKEILLDESGKIEIISSSDRHFDCVYLPKKTVSVIVEEIKEKDIKHKFDIERLINLISEEEYEFINTLNDAKEALEMYTDDKILIEDASRKLLDKISLMFG